MTIATAGTRRCCSAALSVLGRKGRWRPEDLSEAMNEESVLLPLSSLRH